MKWLRNIPLAALVVSVGWTMSAGSFAQDKAKPKPIRPFTMEDLEKKVLHLTFPAGELAKLELRSEEDTDVDLFVQELDGKDVASDIDPSKDCNVNFMPEKDKVYRISIVNLGPGGNKCRLTHNGAEAKVDFGHLTTTKPTKVAGNGTHAINVKLQEGKWAAVWVTSEKATDVDVAVFDPDGNEVAADEHVSKDAFVSFQPRATGVYRIEIRNLDDDENTCTVKHTTLEAPKGKDKK